MLTCSIGGLALRTALRLGVCPQVVRNAVPWGLNSKLTLSDPSNENLDTSDVPNIPNVAITSVTFTESNVRDAYSIDGWRHYAGNAELRNEPVTLETDLLERKEGETIPLGLYETLLIIQHRNKILSDSGIKLKQPEDIASLIQFINEAPNTMYYFPAASYAYHYEPKVNADEELADKFKARNWFLPTAMMIYQYMWLYNSGVFDVAKAKGVFTPPSSAHTTGETSPGKVRIWGGSNTATQPFMQDGSSKGVSKITTSNVFPFVQF